MSHWPQSGAPKVMYAKEFCAARQIAAAAITRTVFFISLSCQTKFIGQCADSLCGSNAVKGLRRDLASPVQLGAAIQAVSVLLPTPPFSAAKTIIGFVMASSGKGRPGAPPYRQAQRQGRAGSLEFSSNTYEQSSSIDRWLPLQVRRSR